MRLFFLCIIACLSGCTLANVQVDVVSERTSLENQILGTYNALDKEMLLIASVRGVDARGNIRPAPKHSQEHKDAVTALQLLAFHEDDIQLFKQLNWVGENQEGLLTPFPLSKDHLKDNLQSFANRYKQEEFDAVIQQINSARTLIMHRVIELNDNLSESDLPNIRQIFSKLNSENAKPGEKIQTQDGQWITK